MRRLPLAAVRALLGEGRVRDVASGATLFEEGDSGSSVFLVLKGTLDVRKALGDGTSASIALRGPQEWLGELLLEDGQVRSATAVAASRARVVELPRKALLGALRESPDALLDMLQAVATKLRESDALLADAICKRTAHLQATNQRLGAELLRLSSAEEGVLSVDAFVGTSAAIERARDAARRAARGESPVLLVGEDGTGKELLARAIHGESPRRDGPFAVVDCSLFGDALMEAELVGHARGALPGAARERDGTLAAAEGGTLYLKHVEALPRAAQSVLFRFLEVGEYQRMGETSLRRAADVRVLSSTSLGLEEPVAQGLFRRDLAERLEVVRIAIPPLRARRGCIPMLAVHLVQATAVRLGVPPPALAPSALRVLSRYDFPGNIDELAAEIEQLVATLPPGAQLTPRDLSAKFVHGDPASLELYSEAVRAFKAQIISHAVAEAGGSRARAAERLGLHRSNLTRMIRELGLNDIL